MNEMQKERQMRGWKDYVSWRDSEMKVRGLLSTMEGHNNKSYYPAICIFFNNTEK